MQTQTTQPTPCPVCGTPNTDNWPLRVGETDIKYGGCQACWESQTSSDYWRMLGATSATTSHKL